MMLHVSDLFSEYLQCYSVVFSHLDAHEQLSVEQCHLFGNVTSVEVQQTVLPAKYNNTLNYTVSA